jgi:hypothetical protein
MGNFIMGIRREAEQAPENFDMTAGWPNIRRTIAFHTYAN